ncbi:sigma-54-dependent Fis family transcriptional regulator [Candidatus Fermentibacterales bacterium]|nr:sigma-54-dependent Fis family transcriptional regulator [Candidatus Fermentibacterales bacterium]
MVTVLGSGTVLIADEKPERAKELSGLVSSLGYSTTLESTARAALRKVHARAVNVVLASATLPDMPSTVFLDTLHRSNVAAGVVLYGESISREDAVILMKKGAVDIIFSRREEPRVLEALQRALAWSSRIVEDAALRMASSEASMEPVLLYRSGAMEEIVRRVRKVAPVNATVLLTGESGTGKDLIARYIHVLSGRTGAYIAINCAAIPETLLESELFGHERGAFTGAEQAREGRFEATKGGTLLLDEVGEIPLSIQVKLLRVLEEGQVTRLGSNRPIPTDVRLIAATNSDLRSRVQERTFREDLFYRLNVVDIHIPPLRARRKDIPLLAMSFLRQASEKHRLAMPEMSPEALEALTSYGWPGNVRQLRNLMESLLIVAGDRIKPGDLPREIAGSRAGDSSLQIELPETLANIEERVIASTLDLSGGNRTKAARLLGIGRRTLQRKLGGAKPDS